MLTDSSAAFSVFSDMMDVSTAAAAATTPEPIATPALVDRLLRIGEDLPPNLAVLFDKCLSFRGLALDGIRIYDDLVPSYDGDGDDCAYPVAPRLMHQFVVVYALKDARTGNDRGEFRYEISASDGAAGDVGFTRVPMQRNSVLLFNRAKLANANNVFATMTAVYAACLVWSHYDASITPRQAFEALQPRMHPPIRLALLAPRPLWVMTFMLQPPSALVARLVAQLIGANQVPVLRYTPGRSGKAGDETHEHSRIVWERANSDIVCFTTTSSLPMTTLGFETEHWVNDRLGTLGYIRLIIKPFDPEVSNL